MPPQKDCSKPNSAVKLTIIKSQLYELLSKSDNETLPEWTQRILFYSCSCMLLVFKWMGARKRFLFKGDTF